MALTTSPERAEQKLQGQALRAIRERAGMSQAEVAEALDMSTQAWSKYEAGERRFKAERMPAIFAALGTDQESLAAERAKILGITRTAGAGRVAGQLMIDVYGHSRAGVDGPRVVNAGEPRRRIDLVQLLGPSTDAFEIAGDAMVPWGEPGEIVLFDRDRYPKRGSGCVIETKAGEMFVKLYEKTDGSTLFARELYPEERVVAFQLADLKGVYAVRLRGD